MSVSGFDDSRTEPLNAAGNGFRSPTCRLASWPSFSTTPQRAFGVVFGIRELVCPGARVYPPPAANNSRCSLAHRRQVVFQLLDFDFAHPGIFTKKPTVAIGDHPAGDALSGWGHGFRELVVLIDVRIGGFPIHYYRKRVAATTTQSHWQTQFRLCGSRSLTKT